MSDFVHLHLHSEYSLLDGAHKFGELVERVKKLGMSPVALTDREVGSHFQFDYSSGTITLPVRFLRRIRAA